jgi:hypothetical protein
MSSFRFLTSWTTSLALRGTRLWTLRSRQHCSLSPRIRTSECLRRRQPFWVRGQNLKLPIGYPGRNENWKTRRPSASRYVTTDGSLRTTNGNAPNHGRDRSRPQEDLLALQYPPVLNHRCHNAIVTTISPDLHLHGSRLLLTNCLQAGTGPRTKMASHTTTISEVQRHGKGLRCLRSRPLHHHQRHHPNRMC